ncbi:auxin-responsive protein SAUR68-like [Actinidia eriantha]|uniref:auxin-responsive protein SAUR68-like n=1 Tax=Actinidia eriantha TaxID=165200 RepID=UPI0025909A85|nr:auxin-responsive protein SAUR68-like [Actinidia eriantha]
MISPNKVITMARNWQKIATIGKKRSSLPRTRTSPHVANKGHFVVYSADRRRFVIPLVYLQSSIFRELFKMSEEEFGLPRDGPITLPCDAVCIDYTLSLIKRGLAQDPEQALVFSVVSRCFSLRYLHQQGMNQRVAVCG